MYTPLCASVGLVSVAGTILLSATEESVVLESLVPNIRRVIIEWLQ